MQISSDEYLTRMTSIRPATRWQPRFPPINLPQKLPVARAPKGIFPFFELPPELRCMIYRECCRQATIPFEELATHGELPEALLTNHSIPNLLRVSKNFKAEYEQEMDLRRARKQLLLQFYCRAFGRNLVPAFVSPSTSPVRKTLANVENLLLKLGCHLMSPLRAAGLRGGMDRLLSMMPSLKYIEININVACCAKRDFYLGDETYDEEDQRRVSDRIRHLVEETVAGLLGDGPGKVSTQVIVRATTMPFLKPLTLSGHDKSSWETKMFKAFANNCPRNHMLLRARSMSCLTARGVLWDVEPPMEPEMVFDDLEATFKLALADRQAGRISWHVFAHGCRIGEFNYSGWNLDGVQL
ncbi:hypothetical protein BST61_g3050 [Cercospora zeina]